jgi:hypothetical protein
LIINFIYFYALTVARSFQFFHGRIGD